KQETYQEHTFVLKICDKMIVRGMGRKTPFAEEVKSSSTSICRSPIPQPVRKIPFIASLHTWNRDRLGARCRSRPQPAPWGLTQGRHRVPHGRGAVFYLRGVTKMMNEEEFVEAMGEALEEWIAKNLSK